MAYPWEDLDDAQFERVVVEMARDLFGAGVQSFTTGKDGGRDARFHGVAERFPSSQEPWSGLTIFQAKHTNGINAHFHDRAFSGTDNESVLAQEMPRIKRLVNEDGASNYFLVANRRLGSITNEKLINWIASETGLERHSIFLAGVEYLDEMTHYLPNFMGRARIHPLVGPLLVSSHDLAEVILAIAEEFEVMPDDLPAPVVDRVSYDEKNNINGMSAEFAKKLLDLYLQYTRSIENFLASPANAESLELYESVVEEFQLKIIAKHDFSQPFDNLFNYLVDLLFSRDGVLSAKKRLTRAVVFYMYWHCDIGRSEDADTEQTRSSG